MTGVDVRATQHADPRVQRRVTATDHRGDDIVRHLDHQPRGTNSRRERSAAVDGLDAERGDQPPIVVPELRESGNRLIGDLIRRVEVGFVRIVLDLDVDPHTRTCVERCVEGGDVGGQVGRVHVDDGSTVRKAGIVMHDQHAVAGWSHVEFDRVTAERRCKPECLDRVLRRGPRCPPMGKYRYHR